MKIIINVFHRSFYFLFFMISLHFFNQMIFRGHETAAVYFHISMCLLFTRKVITCCLIISAKKMIFFLVILTYWL
jgi:hypothetical protein